MNGRLVGVNTMIFSRGGGSNGIGFAIPSEMVRRVVNAAVNGGTLVRPWLGAKGDAVTTQPIAPRSSSTAPRGVLISEVFPGGPAEKAGLKKGDVVARRRWPRSLRRQGHEVRRRHQGRGRDRPPHRPAQRTGTPAPADASPAPPGAAKAELQAKSAAATRSRARRSLSSSPALAEELGLDPFKFQDGMLIYSGPAPHHRRAASASSPATSSARSTAR